MDYTIWRHGVLLGRTDLAMPSAGAETRCGRLTTTSEFRQAWAEIGPVADEFFAAGQAVAATVAEIPVAPPDSLPADRGRQVYDWISAHPGAARLRAARDAMVTLGLELRDAAGNRVPTESVMIQEVRLPGWLSPADLDWAVGEAREEGVDLSFPMYVVVASGITDDSHHTIHPRYPPNAADG